jgi:hypothetical protein
VDEFVFLDNVQYTRRDWRNRNIFRKEAKSFASKWLTIPLESGGSRKSEIQDIEVKIDSNWAVDHVSKLQGYYSNSEFYDDLVPVIEGIKSCKGKHRLSDINQYLIEIVVAQLGLNVNFKRSTEKSLGLDATDRLLTIIETSEATRYLTGPAAKNYIVEQKFDKKGIEIKYADYKNLPPFIDLQSDRLSEFSIVDCLARHGVGKTRDLISFSL